MHSCFQMPVHPLRSIHNLPIPGLIQESLQIFQQATAINPHNIANLKQVRSGWGSGPELRPSM